VKVFWSDYYLESHRVPGYYGQPVADELEKLGVRCYPRWSGPVDLIFCGSIFRMNETKDRSDPRPHTKLVNYSWDIYPWQLEDGKSNQGVDTWMKYIAFLKESAMVLVPSGCQVGRHRQFVHPSLNVKAVKCSVTPIEGDRTSPQERYTVNVMRKYPDANRDAVERCCAAIGLDCRHSGMNMPRREYERLLLGATFLTSGYYEASTGGLSLLEAYARGVPVLLAKSPYNGGVDYFGDRARYFPWHDDRDLKAALTEMRDDPPVHDPAECLAWVRGEYSDAAFARRLKDRFEEVLS
jgi:hypothetical protein